jgi:2-polyprenyl-3-methyl-5-hydroxy-6-metoxy-1,4-benzoquinol methylase
MMQPENLRTFKNSFYEQYVTTHIKGRKAEGSIEDFKVKARNFDQQLRPLIPTSKSAQIVDLGCGNGSIVWWLQNEGYSYSSGVDISQEQIDIGQKIGVKNLVLQDVKQFLNSKASSFDCIIARDFFEHFSKSEIVALLQAAHFALRESGSIIIQVPNGESPFFGRIRYGDFTHETAFTQSSLSQLLNMMGFEKIRCFPVEKRVDSVKSLLRFAAWKFVSCIYKFFLFSELGKGKRVVTQNILSVATKPITENRDSGKI